MKPHPPRPTYTPLTQALLLRCLQASHPEAGLTLLEALMAMFIVTIVLSFIAAPILMTAGTRVKNQETDYALQLAQQRIENARIALITATSWTTKDLNDNDTLETAESALTITATAEDSRPAGIPRKASLTATTPTANDFTSTANAGKVMEVKAPTARCGTAALIVTAVTCNSAQHMEAVDIDNDNILDFYVQTFRTNQIVNPSDGKIIGFDMGIRIYAPQANNSLGSLSTTAASAAMTSRTLSSTQPLTVSYTTLSQGENSQALIALNQCTVANVVGQNAASTADLTAVRNTLNSGLSKPFSVTFTATGATPATPPAKVTTQNPVANSKALCGSVVTISYEGTATPPSP